MNPSREQQEQQERKEWQKNWEERWSSWKEEQEQRQRDWQEEQEHRRREWEVRWEAELWEWRQEREKRAGRITEKAGTELGGEMAGLAVPTGRATAQPGGIPQEEQIESLA